jgi:hypothetical protein
MNIRSNSCPVPAVAVLACAFLLASCSSGPSGPATGSPAWHWDNAQTTWAAGDLQKTADNLESLVEVGNEYADRAQPWRLIIAGGMASGYMSLADAYEQGADINRAEAASFRLNMNNYRSMANTQVGTFYETYMAYKKAAATEPVSLAFSYPKGNATPVADLDRVADGVIISDMELAKAESQVLQRHVVLATCTAVGAPEDTARGQQAFEGESPTVDADTLHIGLARMMNEIASFYVDKKMAQPDRVKLFNEQALELVKPIAEADKDNKDLAELIEEIEDDLEDVDK